MSVSRSGRSFLRRRWAVLAAAAATVAVAGVVGLELFIQSAAHDEARAAQQQFPGDEVEALLALVQSERHALGTRNRAVWALGQLHDARALAVLERYYTGGPCDHGRYLCQYELKKAIDACAGRTWSLPVLDPRAFWDRLSKR